MVDQILHALASMKGMNVFPIILAFLACCAVAGVIAAELGMLIERLRKAYRRRSGRNV